MTILLIGTQPAERAWIEEQVYLLGHDVVACTTGNVALDHCQQMFFPLVILDIELPDMSSPEFCHKLRALPQDTRSLVLVLADMEIISALQAGMDAGADDYLRKPIDRTDFRLRLSILERRTKHEHAMEILRTSQTYAGNIVESSLDMIIAVDLRRHIVEFNKAAQLTFGYRLEEVLGKHVDILYDDTDEAATISQTALLQGRCVREIINKRKNGELFPCLLSASVLHDMYGKPMGIMGISRDITDRKRAEEELKSAHAELERQHIELARASRLKDDFLSLISHELRTPLTVILSQAELLKELMYGTLNQPQLSAIESVENSGHRLLTLINDMLDFSRISQGNLEFKPSIVSVERLCKSSLQSILQEAQTKQLTLSSHLDKDVIRIQVDERLFKQVLLNLLKNAVKFTPNGGEIGLNVQADQQRQIVTFVVWDTGIGIAEEDLERLFQPFVQLDTSLSREYVGAGLGLATVCHIMNMHGGNISVDSQIGEGSRFTATLPWVPDLSENTSTQYASYEKASGGHDDKK